MKTKYQDKYKDFIRRIVEAKVNGVSLMIVREPRELGEDYAELVESLNRLAAADLMLLILPPGMREGASKK